MTAPTSFGTLFIIATPIGNLEDISARAVRTLQSVDWIAAEDTRHSRPLLQHWQIDTPVMTYHAHNEAESAKGLLALLQAGASVALISDAGTPLISDPGYTLVDLAHDQGIPVVPIPGPCSVITALCASGLATHAFCFQGFLPAKSGPRLAALEKLMTDTRTLVFYEAPHRIVDSIDAMTQIFGGERLVVLARELTKKFETIHRTTLASLGPWLTDHIEQQRGEFVIVVAGNPNSSERQQLPLAETLLRELLPVLPLKQAVDLVVRSLGCKKKPIYELALTLQQLQKDQSI